jgi:ABC-type polysaccharide/polyol phosphate export permease
MQRMDDNVPVYDSDRTRWKALEEFVQAARYRSLIFQLIRRDVLSRYKRSVLGVAWTMLNPLGMMLVLTIAFSQLFSGTRAYPAYVLTGLIAWTFFAQTTSISMTQLVWGGALLSRIYVPRTVFALSSIGTGLVNITLSLVPLIVVMLITGAPLRFSALFLPISMLLLALFALGVGLLLSTLAVYFPDVAEMYQILLTAWMYLTPIIYPEEIIPETYRTLLFTLNPMYHLVKIFRQPLYEGVLPNLNHIGLAAAVAVAMFFVGWVIFSEKSDEFAYRV